MRTVVTEVILIVLGVALALLLGTTIISWMTGTIQHGVESALPKAVQIMNVDFHKNVVHMRTLDGTQFPKGDYKVVVDGKETETVSVSYQGSFIEIKFKGSFSESENHSVVVYGPKGLMAMYIYIPP